MKTTLKLVNLLSILIATGFILGSCQTKAPEITAQTLKWTNVQLSSFYSKSRDRMINYAIYTPPGYESTDQHFPVLYVLHGTGSDYLMYWAQISESIPEANGDAGAWLNQLIDTGMISPLIIVTPDEAEGEWGETNEIMVTKELVSYVDSNWRTISNRSGRAIEGFSMGAMGASSYAARNSDLYCSTIIMSLPRRAPQISFWQENREEILDNQLGVRLIVGEADPRYDYGVQFHNELLAIEIPHEFETYPDIVHYFGALYNQSGIEGLQFHTDCFENTSPPLSFMDATHQPAVH